MLHGAYGNILDDIEPLADKEPEVPESDKDVFGTSCESDYMIALDNVFCTLSHQMSFYPATYIALPYLANAFNYWYEKDDFIMQVWFLVNTGIIVSTDIEYNIHYEDIKHIKESPPAKLDMLKQADLTYICIPLMALTGEREHACCPFIQGSTF